MDIRALARAIGLRQRTLADLLGESETGVSVRLRRGGARRDWAILGAWWLMTPAQRHDWLIFCGLRRRPRQPLLARVKFSARLKFFVPAAPQSLRELLPAPDNGAAPAIPPRETSGGELDKPGDCV